MAGQTVNTGPALAPIFLQHWLDNRSSTSTFTFHPPTHLRQSSYVLDVLQLHRDIFLSKQPAANGSIVGAITRLRSGAWNLADLLRLDYHSLVSVGDSLYDLVRIRRSGTAGERDLLTALRGFQLHSRVWLEGRNLQSSPRRVEASIHWWMAYVTDRYDWDYSEHFTVPNPDYRSTAADAVRSGDRELTVYHSNARRLEQANLAAPYDIRSDHWHVTGSLLSSARETLRP
jgi:hypothetical protein